MAAAGDHLIIPAVALYTAFRFFTKVPSYDTTAAISEATGETSHPAYPKRNCMQAGEERTDIMSGYRSYEECDKVNFVFIWEVCNVSRIIF